MASRELNILIRAKNLASGAIKGVKRELGGIERDVGRGLRNAGRNIERGLIIGGAAAVGGLALAVKTAAEFEDAFAGVVKTVDEAELALAGLTFEDLMNSFREMAREMPIAFEELAAIGEAAGALGIAAGDIDEFTEVVAKMGVTTDLTSEEAATAMGHLATILGLTGEEFEDVADALVNLGNNGASTESQIISIAERFAASGKSAGLATEDILALASTAASMGIEVEAAGSSLSRVFDEIATGIGTGSKEAEAFADALNLSAEEFRDAWEQDAIGTFQEFLGVLGELDQFEAAALLQDVGITGVRDVRAIRLLAGGAEELADQLGVAREAAGALNEEAEKKFATTASQWTKFQNIVRDIGYVIGLELLPIVNELLTDFAEFMALPSTQAGIKQFAQDLATNVREAVEWLKSLDWETITGAMKAAAGFAKGLLEAFLGMPGWVQTAVLTGWGLNKLTGGAVGSIVGTISAGIGKALLQKIGLMNVNAGVVNVNGGVRGGLPGVGGGAPAAAAAGGGLAGAAALGAGVALPFLMFNLIPELFKVEGAKPTGVRRTNEQGETIVELGPTSTAMMTGLMPGFQAAVKESGGEIVTQGARTAGAVWDVEASLDDTRAEVRDLNDPLGTLADLNRQQTADAAAADAAMLGSLSTLKAAQDAADAREATRHAQAIDRQNTQIARLDAINAKDFSPSVGVSVTTNTSVDALINVSATHIAQSIRINQAASQTSFGGRGGESRF